MNYFRILLVTFAAPPPDGPTDRSHSCQKLTTECNLQLGACTFSDRFTWRAHIRFEHCTQSQTSNTLDLPQSLLLRRFCVRRTIRRRTMNLSMSIHVFEAVSHFIVSYFSLRLIYSLCVCSSAYVYTCRIEGMTEFDIQLRFFRCFFSFSFLVRNFDGLMGPLSETANTQSKRHSSATISLFSDVNDPLATPTIHVV